MPAVIYELLDKGTFVGQDALIRYHFVDVDGVADPAIMVDDYVEHVIPALQTIENADYLHTSIIYKQVYPIVGLQQERPIVPPAQGSHTSATLPAWISLSVKWVIGATVHLGTDAGPHIKRGGKHLGGLSDDEVVGNVLSNPADTATKIAAYYAALQVLGEDQWLLCVAHQPPPVDRVSPPVTRYALVTGAVVQGVGSQNTRKRGAGR